MKNEYNPSTTEYNPEAFCQKCHRMSLPPKGHWASHCLNTICPECHQKAPGHYRYDCPNYLCPICTKFHPRHRPEACPNYAEYAKRLERMNSLIPQSPPPSRIANVRAELEDGDWFDDVSIDYSTTSR